MAVVVLREMRTALRERGTAPVQAVGVVDVVAGELRAGGAKTVSDGAEGAGRGKRGGTVSLSQLIQRGTMMLVRVMAQAAGARESAGRAVGKRARTRGTHRPGTR